MKLDQIIAGINADLGDIMTPVVTRFRFLLGAIFDYTVANPTSTAAQAQTAILATFNATYADGLVSNLTATTVLTAFINRHGTGADLAAKWISVRDWIVERKDHRATFLGAMETGVLPNIGNLWARKMLGGVDVDLNASLPLSDLVETTIRETTPGPLINAVKEFRYSSASLVKTIRKTRTNAFDGVKISFTESDWEIV